MDMGDVIYMLVCYVGVFGMMSVIFGKWSTDAKHGLLCQISELLSKYFILKNLGNPYSCLRPRHRNIRWLRTSKTSLRAPKVVYERKNGRCWKLG
ncbi:hypothetical protein CsSME_00025605 [Camellia sinensis var. sinensis]